MISNENINTLYSASELSGIADLAPDEHLKNAVARACNLAANTGEKSIEWNQSLTETLKAELISKGYTVIPKTDVYHGEIKDFYIISFTKSDE